MLNYLLLGGASGFTLATAFAAVRAPELRAGCARWALLLTLLALVAARASLLRNARLKPNSTLQTRHRHQAPAHRAERAGFHGRILQHARVLPRPERRHAARGEVVLSAGRLRAAGLVLLAAGAGRGIRHGAAAGAAFVVQYLGLLAERWFFFAQANHPQNLYYQAVS